MHFYFIISFLYLIGGSMANHIYNNMYPQYAHPYPYRNQLHFYRRPEPKPYPYPPVYLKNSLQGQLTQSESSSINNQIINSNSIQNSVNSSINNQNIISNTGSNGNKTNIVYNGNSVVNSSNSNINNQNIISNVASNNSRQAPTVRNSLNSRYNQQYVPYKAVHHQRPIRVYHFKNTPIVKQGLIKPPQPISKTTKIEKNERRN
ncbi:unnamed protein product [Brachionus calyciflorus]|uniref:Uncharacterized protein n=1 Tax=Brachionus calyciflorus TaxID=104777 RepID=A0A814NTF0_9BILA|nr:unnamed protein product [Brachionus calyciflorus]